MSFVYRTGFLRKCTGRIAGKTLSSIKNKIKSLLQCACRARNKERTFSCAFFLQGSLTIESAVALPLVILFAVGMITFLAILSVQLDLQNGMEETARNLTRKAYLAKKSDTDAGLLGPAAVAIDLNRDPLRSRLEHSGIKGGAGGVNALFSTYEDESGILDIIVQYNYRIPVLPDRIAETFFVQRMRSRAWIGRELDTCGDSGDDSGKENAKENGKVYVTENGSVYHTSKDCHYLDLSIHRVSPDRVADLRNKDGAKYYGCPLCAKGGAKGGQVYITDYGENWHTSLECSGLKRTVIEKDKDDIGNLKLCSKCGSRHE